MFTFHGSRRNADDISVRTDNFSLGASLRGDVSSLRKITPPTSQPFHVSGGLKTAIVGAIRHPSQEVVSRQKQAQELLEPCAVNEATKGGLLQAAPHNADITVENFAPAIDVMAATFVRPQTILAQHLMSGAQDLGYGGADFQTPSAGLTAAQSAKTKEREAGARGASIYVDDDDDEGGAVHGWNADRMTYRNIGWGQRRRRLRAAARTKQSLPKGTPPPKPHRKIFYSEREGKWIEHRIYESEELGGSPAGVGGRVRLPLPEVNPARRRRAAAATRARPHKVKGRKTSKMREMLPTAFVKGPDKQDQRCRKIEVTDQLRIDLYKRNMPVVPTFYQEHIYKFGKPPFRGNPRPI